MISSEPILTGPIKYSDVSKYLAAADILIAPFNTSRFKHLEKYGFWWCPVKIFEYMAVGKPIISYDYVEVRKIMKNTGLLAKPGNLEDFKNKLRTLINNKELRHEYGRKARILSLKYEWKKRAEEINEVYNETIKS